MRAVVVALGTCACAGVARAQVPSDSVVRARPIDVHAARGVTSAGGASALEVRVDSLALPAAPTLEQVLRELPLVQVRTNSRGEVQFSLRGSGSDARQVAVLLDGIPLNLGWDDRADLSVLPATAATSLTLVRGLPSMLYGPNVLGGVVEVAVAQGPAPPPERVAAYVAADHTGAFAVAASAAASLALTRGSVSVRAGGGHRDRRGFALPDALGDSAAASVADAELRRNTDLRHSDGFVALRYAAAGGAWVSLASSAFDAERGVAAELHAERPRFWRYPDVARWVSALTAGTGDRASLFGGRGDLEASIGVDVGRTSIVSYHDASYRDVADTETADDRTLTLRLLADQTLGSAGDLRLALTGAEITHDELLSGIVRDEYRQRIWSAGAETVWRIATPSSHFPVLRLSVGGALDGADTPESGDKPPLRALTDWGARAGLTAAHAHGTLLLHAGASRRARFPALRELYSGALGRFEPNPALRPEVLTAAEAGVTGTLPGAELQLVTFLRNLDQAIEQITLADGRRQRVNLGASRSAGAEALGTVRAGRAQLSADITLQRVRLHGSAAAGVTHPEYQPAITGGAGFRYRLPFDIAIAADTRFVGRQYCADPNAPGELALDPSARTDLSVSRSFGSRNGDRRAPHADLLLAADNVADAVVYDQCGLPQPGRTLRAQLRIQY